ncbi:MAG: hypothetical protein AAF512_18855, partial [Pseudomonadota bacterium]
VFAAYRSGGDYYYKVSVRCLNAKRTVMVVVVTPHSGVGQNKANSILRDIRQRASSFASSSSSMSASSYDDGDDDESFDDEDYDDDEYYED